MKKTGKIHGLMIICSLAVAVFCALSLSKDVYADEYYEMVIIDYAGLLTESEEDELYEYMEQITPYGNVIFQTVILEQESYEEYCENTYYEYFGNEPGVIFQIDMGSRKLTLSSSTGLDEEIASERDSIVDNVYEYASDGDYLACAEECFYEVFAVLNDETIAHNMKYIDNAIIAVIISLILNYFLVFATGKKKTSARKIISTVAVTTAVTSTVVTKGYLKKVYSPQSSGSGSSGGGFSGGGGGGGGFSGGSSSHGF